MDKSWMMITDRLKSKEYIQGVQSFMEFATKNLRPQDEIRCPCVDCLNGTKLPRHVVRLHLLRRGIACSYRTWVHHGERVPLFRGHPTMRNDDTQTDRAAMTTNHENVDELPTMLQEIYMSGLMDDHIDEERTMVPGVKTGRRKRATSGNVLSTSEACQQEIGTPMTFSDETQPPDDTQTVVEETQPGGVGQTRSTRVRRPTLGKGVQKKIARKKGEKLHVYVNRVLNAITGGNATPATNELGLQIRQLCPLQSVKSWIKIDQSTKDAVIQAVLDKFVIGDDFDNDEQAQQILDRKAYLLYKDWMYNLKQEFLELEEKGVDDPYSHPPTGVSLEDWKYLIDVAWKDESHLKRSTAGKANRGPQPSSTASSAARARDKHMELMRAELEVLREQRQSDHEELLKEKEERQRDREELLKEKEARERDREEITREREQLIKQVDEEKKAREAQQVQLNHLNDVVSRLTTLLPGSDGHPTIR
ncbi:hypothetical protein ACSBR1_006394 [Camellia fascicularis]